jgi:two-component system NtrC family sensor kinase
MRLARKLTIGLVLGILAVMATYAVFQLRQEVVLSQADLQRARRIGKAWLGTITDVWKREGEARAYELAQRANESVKEVTIRLIPFEDAHAAAADLHLSAAQRQALDSGDVVRVEGHDAGGREFAHAYVALSVDGRHPAVVEYIEPREKEETFIAMSHLALAAATLGVVAVCGLIATGLQYRLVGRPLQLLRNKAQRAGEGDFSGPLLLHQNDEMGELAREINAMCERIEAANRQLAAETEARVAALEQLRHTDRLATVGQLAAGVAHELGTPLSVASARSELIAATSAQGEVVQHARVIDEQCDRMTAIIQQLLDFSRRRGRTPGLTDLRHLVTGAVELLSTAAEKAAVGLTCTAGDSPMLVYVDQNQIQQALTNIVLNGIQAMPNGGTLHVEVRSRRARPPDAAAAAVAEYAAVTIEDHGAGIAAADLAHIFEPFFTTKGVGKGTGLGLAVAHGIVAEHGGWISVESVVGTGSIFSIFLPLTQTAGARQGAA